MGRSLNRFLRRGCSPLPAAPRRPSSRRPRTDWVREPLRVEELEPRTVPTLILPGPVTPTPLPLPAPLVPDPGDQSILENVLDKSVSNRSVLDHLPVPFVIVASAGGNAPIVTDGHSHAPVKIDADGSEATGQGGSGADIQVEVDAFVTPTPHLVMTVERLGTAPFATNLSVVIAFPWAGFDLEPGLPSTPNLVMGFQTSAPGGAPGGYAPLQEVITLTPGTLAGTSHSFTATMSTTAADNPLSFILGNLDGTNLTGTLNAAGFRAYVENVPATITTTVTTSETSLASPIDSSFNLNWQASSASLVKLDYLESVGPPGATPDFNTSLVANPMPVNEQFALRVNEPGGQTTVSQLGSDPINSMTFQKTRSDGLAVVGTGSAVPTQLGLVLNHAGSATLTDNANVGIFAVQAAQAGGFPGSSGFLPYNLGTVGVAVTNAPSLSAAYSLSGTSRTFAAAPAVAGNVVGGVELLVSSYAPAGAQLPDHWADPDWDIFSLVDDGTNGTVASRALSFSAVTFTHSPDIKVTVELQTVAPHPMETYLKAGLLSVVQPPVPAGATAPDPYIEVTGHIQDVPIGHTKVTLAFPLKATWVSDNKIDEICMAGHIGFTNFALVLSGNPTVGSFDFRPEGSVAVTAQDGMGNPDFFTANAAVVYDVTGFNPAIVPWPVASSGTFHSASKTFFPLGTPLKEARLRLDHVPSMMATWDNENQHTYIDIGTNAASGQFAYVGGVQIQVSTKTTLGGTTLTCDNVNSFLPPAATPTSEHYALLRDVAGEQTLAFGIFGVHTFHYNGDDTTKPSKFTIDWSLDPSRPFTAAHVTADTHSTASGALGTFFGGDTVTGPLDVAEILPDFHITGNMEPTLSTGSLFPGGLPIPNVINWNFVDNGTQIFVYAQAIPKNFSVTWNIGNPTTTLSVTSQDNAGNPDKAQVVEVLFLNPSGLPGGDKLFNDASDPLRELRVRLDDVPSLTSSWTTTGATNINIQTTNTVAPFDVLGGLRISTSTVAGSTVLPTFPTLTGTEDHYVTLQDGGAGKDKTMAFGLFGVRQFTYTDPGWVHTTYNGNVNRRLVVTINSNNGRFFPGHVIQAALVVNTLPGLIDLLLATDGTDLSYRASSGIGSIQIGGLAVAGLPGDAYATIDTRRAEVSLSGMPSQFGYDLANGNQFGLSAGAKITNLTAHLRDSGTGGLDNGSGPLGAPLRDVQLRVDGVPSFTGDSTALIGLPYTASNAGTRPVAGNVLYDTTTGATAVVTEVDSAGGMLFDTGQAKVRLARTAAFAKTDFVDVLDALPFNSQTGLFNVGDVITGKTSGATATVRRVDQLAAAGTLYFDGVSGTFQNGEQLLVNGQVMALVNGTLQAPPAWTGAAVAGDPTTLESQMDFSTSVPGVSLTGVQVGLSTRFEDPDNSAFTVSQPPNYYLNLFDENVVSVGEVARLRAGLSTIQQISYANVNQAPPKSSLTRFHLVADTARELDVNLDTEFGSKLTKQGYRGTLTVQNVPAKWDLTTDFDKTLDHKASDVISHIHADLLKDDSGDGYTTFKGHHIVLDVQDVPTMLNFDGGINDTTATPDSPVTKQHMHIHANGPVTSVFLEDTKDVSSSTGRPSWMLLQVNGLPGSVDYNVEKDFSVDDKKNLSSSPTKSSTTVAVTDPGGNPAPLTFFRFVNSKYQSRADTLANDLGLFTGLNTGLVQQTAFAQAVDDRYWPAGVQVRLNDIYGSSFHLGTNPTSADPTFLLDDHFLKQSFGEAGVPGVQIALSGTQSATATTDANGGYTFTGLAAGNYTLTETPPGGVPDGKSDVGNLGGTAGTDTVSNINVGTNPDMSVQQGTGYDFGTGGLPNPGLTPGPTAPGVGAGTLSGHVYWDQNGDGIYNATDLVDYTDVQLHGFQSAEDIEDTVAKNTHVELQVPSTGSHPFFVGDQEERNKATLARMDNLPSSVKVDYTEKNHLDFTAASSAGRVDIYQGPLPFATDNDKAIRAILINAPMSLHIGYGIGFPNGGIDFTADRQFELRLLDQDGSSQRIVAGLSMQELRVGYGLSGLLIGGGFGDNVNHTDLGIDDAWWLLKYAAGIANNTDGTGIQGTDSKAHVNGFFGLYERRNDIQDLNPAGPAHGSQEYVPQVTVRLKDFKEFSFNIGLVIDPLHRADNEIAWIFPVGVVAGVTSNLTLDFDFWLNGLTFPHISALGFDIGFINRPDYIDNSPFMVFPMTTTFGRLGIDHDAVITFEGFHYLSDEVDPFGPQLAPGQGPGAPPADVIATVPDAIVNEALARWQAAGYDTGALGTVKVGVTDLTDNYLGTVTDGTVWIDRTAAGYGWYIDPTPGNDSEFPAAPGGPAYGREDLLTVVMHEIGHLFGYGDGGQGLMETVLQPGERFSPAPQPRAAGGADGSPTAAVPLGSAATGGGSALPLSFAGVPLTPGRLIDDSLAALVVMLSPVPSAPQAPAALNDPHRAAVLDTVYSRFDNAHVASPLSDHLAPSHLLGLAELHPPHGRAFDSTALAAVPADVPWQAD
jgi:hypothetical protein